MPLNGGFTVIDVNGKIKIAATGAAGPTGNTGLIGPQGPQGLGTPGSDGEDGLDSNIPGPPGLQGIQGVVGSQGPQGLGVPGTDGDDGFDGWPGPMGPVGATGAAGVGSGILQALINITDTQFRSLNTTPQIVVATPGSGKILIPIGFAMTANVTSGFSTYGIINVQYTGGAAGPLTGANYVSSSVAKRVSYSSGGSLQTPTTGMDNTSLEVVSATNTTGGTTSGGFNFYLWYMIITTP